MKCKYCNKEIIGYVETSKLDPRIKLCTNCHYIELFEITIAKIINEMENKYDKQHITITKKIKRKQR